MTRCFAHPVRRAGRLVVALASLGGAFVAEARPAHAEPTVSRSPSPKPTSMAKPKAHDGAAPQGVESAKASEGETRDPVLVRPFVQILYASFSFDNDDAVELEIVPNPTSNLGVTLGAWGFSLSLSKDVGRVEAENEYGDSDNFNVEFAYPFRVFGERELDVTAFLHYHHTLSMSREGAPRQIVDGAVITTLGLDFALVFDPKFSIADAFADFAPRTGSRGSFFARSSLELWFLGFLDEPERRLIPEELNAGFGDFVDLNGLSLASATLSAGYAYDWNFARNFFLGMLGSLGFAGSLLELSFASTEEERSEALGAQVALQLAGSLVTRDFHAGLVTGVIADVVNTHRIDVVAQRLSTMLFAGVRF